MSKNLYVATTGPGAGKSAIVLGLMSLFEREIRNIGFFRPIARPESEESPFPDSNVELVCSVFDLQCDPKVMTGVTDRQAMELITAGKYDELMEEILSAYKRYEEGKDFVLIEGTNYQGPSTAFEFDVNADIAANLAAPVLLVVSGRGRSINDICENVVFSKDQFDERGCDLLAVMVNRLDMDTDEDVVAELAERFVKAKIPFAGAIPEEPVLSKPRMDEVVRALKAEVLFGERYLDNLVYSFRIASMQISTLLDRLDPGSLVITAADRIDVVLGLLCSQLSNRMSKMSGILLTSGFRFTDTVQRLIQGLRGTQLPILLVNTGTYQTSQDVSNVASVITPKSFRKIEMAQFLFDEHINSDVIRSRISTMRATRLTPKMFLHQLLERARSNRRHIVLPEGLEDRILRAADGLMRRNVVDITLLGDENTIRNRAEKLLIDLDGVNIVNPASSARLTEYAQVYAELRKHKGMSNDQALEIMQDPTYYGTMMVYQGHAGGMVSGSINTTAHTIRPAFEFIKTKPGVSLVSSVFFMCLSDRVLVYGDCAVNPNPTAQELAQIAISSADTAEAFGVPARVAMLSYATGSSGKGEDVEMVTEATRIAREQRPDLAIEGPIQYDAAVDAGVARTKLPKSSVAGRATVFIFPDLNTGNNTYKAVQRSANAIAVGPVLQGLNKPVNDLSRGCTVPDIINTVAITAIQAQQNPE